MKAYTALKITFATAVITGAHTAMATVISQEMGGNENFLTGLSSLGGAFSGATLGTLIGGALSGSGNGNDAGLGGALLGFVVGYAAGSVAGFAYKFSK